MNYDEMPAGQIMNGLVAEKVLGRRWVNGVGRNLLLPGHSVENRTFMSCLEVGRLESLPDDLGGLPDYSGDIAWAWEVVEAMEKRGWWVADSVNGYYMTFRVAPEEFRAHGSTFPLAICRAALKAALSR